MRAAEPAPAVPTVQPAAPAAAPAHKATSHKATPRKAKTRRARHTRRRVHAEPVFVSNGMKLGLRETADDIGFKSSAALVIDQDTGETVALKNADVVLPIASVTKLMTALVVVDSGAPLDETLTITADDVDSFRGTYSRLTVGTRLTRDQLLLLALMSSENRAAMALSRNYPGGRAGFVAQMNAKAAALGMTSSHFADPAGLSNDSVSTARDLHRLVVAAYAQPLIRNYTTQAKATVRAGRRTLTFVNSNQLVRGAGNWDIELQKTGFTNEAGRCLVMQAKVLTHRLAMIFLDSTGKLTRYADAARVRKYLESEAKAALRHAPAGVVAAPPAAS